MSVTTEIARVLVESAYGVVTADVDRDFVPVVVDRDSLIGIGLDRHGFLSQEGASREITGVFGLCQRSPPGY